MLGAAFVGSFLVVAQVFYMSHIRKLFPDIVSGVVVTLIGLTILPVAMNWIGDAPQGHPEFATLPKVFLAAASLAVVIGVSVFCKGVVAASSIIIGLAAGYMMAIPMGMVDVTRLVKRTGWLRRCRCISE